MAPAVPALFLGEAAPEAAATVLRANWCSALTGMVVDLASPYSASYAAEEDEGWELAAEADGEELVAEAEEELAVGATATRITGASTSWTSLMPCGGSALLSISSVARGPSGAVKEEDERELVWKNGFGSS